MRLSAGGAPKRNMSFIHLTFSKADAVSLPTEGGAMLAAEYNTLSGVGLSHPVYSVQKHAL